jgi:long-chain acyl-CoA synthetase
LQSFLIAVVVPEEGACKKWAVEAGKGDASLTDLVKDADLKKTIIEDMKRIGKEDGLFTFELAQDIFITTTPFTVENDLLTPTMKLKRHESKQLFYTQIKEMYNGAKLQGED